MPAQASTAGVDPRFPAVLRALLQGWCKPRSEVGAVPSSRLPNVCVKAATCQRSSWIVCFRRSGTWQRLLIPIWAAS